MEMGLGGSAESKHDYTVVTAGKSADPSCTRFGLSAYTARLRRVW